jgi:hypothetical protein
VPNNPYAPNTAISGDTASITWTAPANGGSTITAYIIKLYNPTTNLGFTELTNCNGSDLAIVFDKACLIPLTILQGFPFSIKIGEYVQADIVAINGAG